MAARQDVWSSLPSELRMAVQHDIKSGEMVTVWVCEGGRGREAEGGGKGETGGREREGGGGRKGIKEGSLRDTSVGPCHLPVSTHSVSSLAQQTPGNSCRR